VRGHVDDVGDLGHRLPDRHRDALAEGDSRQAATLAATGEAHVGDALLDRDEVGAPAVHGDLRVDLVLDHRSDSLGERGREVGLGDAAAAGLRRRRVRVEHHQARAFCGILADVEGGAPQPVDARRRHDDDEVPTGDDLVARCGVRHRLEPHVVGIGAVVRPVHLDEEREPVGVGLASARLGDKSPGTVGEREHRPLSARAVAGRRSEWRAHLTQPTPGDGSPDGRERIARTAGAEAASRHHGSVTRLALVLPTASYRAAELLAAAARLDVEVVVASERRQAFAARRPDRFLEVDLEDAEGAAAVIAAQPGLDGVLSVDDQGLLTAALAAQRLGLRHSDPAAVAVTRDKVAMRRLLAAAQVPQPDFAVVDIDGARPPGEQVAAAAARLGFPVVVKPPHLSGSRGVIRADDEASARRAATRTRAVLADAGGPAAQLLVESFVPGAEIAVEGLLRAGELEVLAIFDKPDPLDGPFFEETIYVTPSRLPAGAQARAGEVAGAACRAIGLAEGAVHAEARIRHGDGEVVVIEVAARTIGGRCAKALRFATGAGLDDLVIAHAVGIDAGRTPRREAAAGVLMIPIPASGRLVAVEGVERVRATPGVTGVELTIPLGAPVRALPEGDRYLGFVFARAGDPARVEALLRDARDAITVRVEQAEGGDPPPNRQAPPARRAC
jgi:biotin carboxylase